MNGTGWRYPDHLSVGILMRVNHRAHALNVADTLTGTLFDERAK